MAETVSHRRPSSLPGIIEAIDSRLIDEYTIDVVTIPVGRLYSTAQIIGSVLADHTTDLLNTDSYRPKRQPHRVVSTLEYGFTQFDRLGGGDLESKDSVMRGRSLGVEEHYVLLAARAAIDRNYPEIQLAAKLARKWDEESHFRASGSARLLLATYGVRIDTVPTPKHKYNNYNRVLQ